MRTVREALQGGAIAQGVSPERFAAIERGWLNNHVDLCVPEGYRRLALDWGFSEELLVFLRETL